MIADALKKSLLQAAIQGKLTEQLPEDGDARDLLKEIQKEKARLVKEGQLKKEKPLPEITEDEIPFDIPDNWVWVRLGDVVLNARSGGTPDTKTSKYYGGNIPFVTIKDMTIAEKYIDVTLSHITELGLENSSAWLVEKNHILYSMYASIGKVSINTIPLATSQAIIALQLIDNNTLRNYTYFYLRSLEALIYRFAAGTTQLNINAKIVKELLIPLPSVEEQKRIVEKIEELLLEIEILKVEEIKLDNLEKAFPSKIRASILQAAIQGKLTEHLPEDGDARDLLKEIQKEKARLIKEGKIKKEKPLPDIKEDEIPFEIPDNWVWCTINHIAFVTKLAGFEYTKYIAPNLSITGIPLFKGKNIQNGKLISDFESFIPESISTILIRSQLNKKCLLTPYVGTIGNIAIFDGSFKAHLGSNVGKIEIFNNNKINVSEEYLLLFLLSTTGFQQLSKFKKSTAQESTSIQAIRDTLICFPPLAEQYRIVEKVNELLPLCEGLE